VYAAFPPHDACITGEGIGLYTIGCMLLEARAVTMGVLAGICRWKRTSDTGNQSGVDLRHRDGKAGAGNSGGTCPEKSAKIVWDGIAQKGCPRSPR